MGVQTSPIDKWEATETPEAYATLEEYGAAVAYERSIDGRTVSIVGIGGESGSRQPVELRIDGQVRKTVDVVDYEHAVLEIIKCPIENDQRIEEWFVRAVESL